uniref:UBX domain-containing protein 11 n=1 Tax=Echeneis naucrates TaxID=173247 RepID=A0A665UW68_ECHNA
MFDGPFRSYQERSTQQCMQDLMDGYFPSELQERFPDGVPFEVSPFLLLACQKMYKVVTYQKLTVQVHDRRDEEFIFRLPWEKSKSRAGRVIDIRNSLRANLQGSSNVPSSDSMIFINTAALQKMRERLDQPSSAHDVITLKVKSEDGSQTYILKMCFSETIDFIPSSKLSFAYPQSCYNDNYKTLQSCGLTTNAALLLRKRQHCPSLTGVK